VATKALAQARLAGDQLHAGSGVRGGRRVAAKAAPWTG